MNLEDFKQFVINYKTFNWESRDYGESDFRDTMKFKHSFLMSFIRFYKVNKYLENLIDEKNISNPKIVDVGAYPGNMAVLSKKIFKDISDDIEERKVTYTIKDWLELRKNTIGY